MGPSEAEIERRLAALRREREAIDRAIADHLLYLELGRRLAGAPPAAEPADRPEPRRDGAQGPEARPETWPGARPGAQPAAWPGPSAAASPPTDFVPTDVAPANPAGPPVPPAAFEEDPVAARRYGRAVIAAALEVLAETGAPMHASEILAALAARGFTLPGQDPVAGLNTRLWKRSGPGGPLRRLGEAVYALAEG
ncbi:winged helix-turn-helix domain-containing protein [Methylobacterium sp. A54F]